METSLLDVQDQMKAVLEQLAEVHEQTHTNGGASLKDIATRTESRVVSLEHNLSDHFDDAKHRDERLAAIEQDHHTHHHNEEST
jgi:hypothetical protein